MKRITWWPQLWLGLNFNWGLLVGYYSVSDIKLNITIILFYTGSIFGQLLMTLFMVFKI